MITRRERKLHNISTIKYYLNKIEQINNIEDNLYCHQQILAIMDLLLINIKKNKPWEPSEYKQDKLQ